MKKWTLKKQMLLSFLMVALIPTLFVLSYYFVTVQRSTQQQLLTDNTRDLRYAMDQVEAQANQVSDFMNWVTHNEDILILLSRTTQEANIYDHLYHDVINQLEEQLSYRPINQHLQSLFLKGVNGLDIRNGSEASLVSPENIRQLIGTISYDTTHWGGQIENNALFTQEPYVIPYCCPIRDEAGVQRGWLVLLFSESLFANQYEGLMSTATNPANLRNGNGDLICGRISTENENGTVLTEKLLSNGWRLDLHLTESTLDQQRFALISTVGLFGTLLLGVTLLLSWQLTQTLSKPIDRIINQVRLISVGEFHHRDHRFEKTELDYLENSIMDMQDSIQKLMELEKDKQQLEIRILQSQMNPHFLYHTLNVIKIMASMQGKKSISNMTDALVKILRANLSVHSSTVSLSQELELLESYMYIQNISQKGRLHWSTDGVLSDLYVQQVPKFLLQPLVENAIAHGFAGRPEGGNIKISGLCEEQDMILIVQDDGQGMDESRLAQVLRTLEALPHNTDSSHTHGIALVNVQRRIHLHYGDRYGLTIDSKAGAGCCIKIRLPMSKSKEEMP